MTITERLQNLEIKEVRRQAIQEIAAELADQLANGLVPISTHVQLLQEQSADRGLVSQGVIEAILRLGELTNKLRLLARDQGAERGLLRWRQLEADLPKTADVRNEF
jgi:signal transduction histidine kinase